MEEKHPYRQFNGMIPVSLSALRRAVALGVRAEIYGSDIGLSHVLSLLRVKSVPEYVHVSAHPDYNGLSFYVDFTDMLTRLEQLSNEQPA